MRSTPRNLLLGLFCVLGALASPYALARGDGGDARSSSDDGYPYATAPDGHRGFGAQPKLREIEKLFRKAEAADVEFLASILDLTGDVRVLLRLARTYYERRGYHALLRRGDTFEMLAHRFELTYRDALRRPMDPVLAQAFVRLMLDTRYWVREEVARAWEEEVRELRGGISFFVAHTFGVAEFTGEAELARITQRVDLSAARLRALRLDLEALYQSPARTDNEPDDFDAERLIDLLVEGDGQRARRLMLDLERRTKHGRTRLRETLFTLRLESKLDRELMQRRKGVARAKGVYLEVLALLPLNDVNQPPPAEIAAMTTGDRHKKAASAGVEGLFHDPFHAELNYMVGIAYDFFAGRHFSRAYFDRFLVLRGIRHYDHRTYAKRDLSLMEEYALLVVADWRPPKQPD